jgi:hypothetical protein
VTALALVLAPLTCSVVLIVSGAAKVGNAEATRAAFVAMDVPTFLRARPVVRSLPYIELALGVALLATWGWLLAVVAVVVTALFLTYFVLVARALRSGEQVHCNCFGTIGDDRVTWATLARNGVLVVLGVLTTAFGAAGSGVVPAFRDFEGSDWWWPVMVALVVAAAVLVTAPGRPDSSADVPEEELLDYLRQRIPFAMLEDPQGEHTTLRKLAAERAQLLVFLSTGCYSCIQVGEHLADWAVRLSPVELSAVFTQDLGSVPSDFDAEGVRKWRDIESGTSDAFASSGRPAAVLLGADGMLAGGPVTGYAAVTRFVDEILAELESGDAPAQPENPEAGAESLAPAPPHDHVPHDHDHDHDHAPHDHAPHDREAEASA